MSRGLVLVLVAIATHVVISRGDNLPWEKGECPIQSGKRIIFYNSIPKTGSTTLRTLISRRQNATAEGFAFVQVHEHRYRKRTPIEICALLKTIESKLDGKPRVVFDEHIYFANFSKCPSSFPQSTVAYVNLMRQPVPRVISRYFYELSVGNQALASCLTHVNIDSCLESDPIVSGEWNPAVEHDLSDGYCVRYHMQKQSPKVPTAHNALCFNYFQTLLKKYSRRELVTLLRNRESYFLRDETNNYNTKHLCGQTPECHERTRFALEKAKRNVENVYSFVGVTEYLDLSWLMLWKLFPDFFGEMRFQDLEVGLHFRVTTSEHKRDRHSLSRNSIQWLSRHNQMDLELYRAVFTKFRKQVRSCFSPCESLTALHHSSDLLQFYSHTELSLYLSRRSEQTPADEQEVMCRREITTVLGAKRRGMYVDHGQG